MRQYLHNSREDPALILIWQLIKRRQTILLKVFKIVPSSSCYTEFFIPEINISIVPRPEGAVLKGENAPYYKVEQVRVFLQRLSSPSNNCIISTQEEIESAKYRKVIFYDINKKPQLPHTLSLLVLSTRKGTAFGKSFDVAAEMIERVVRGLLLSFWVQKFFQNLCSFSWKVSTGKIG